jgi:hypothetical protein
MQGQGAESRDVHASALVCPVCGLPKPPPFGADAKFWATTCLFGMSILAMTVAVLVGSGVIACSLLALAIARILQIWILAMYSKQLPRTGWSDLAELFRALPHRNGNGRVRKADSSRKHEVAIGTPEDLSKELEPRPATVPS